MNSLDTCKERRYLVTGASGFIGRAVCEQLLLLGAEVHGTSRREVVFDSGNWTHHPADLTDADAVDALFAAARPEYLIHLASFVTGKREIDRVRETLTGNLVSAVNVLVAASNVDVDKAVLAGSLEEPESGDAAVIPASPYAASKWSASGYARMMHALYDLDVAVARIFMVYGPGQEDRSKLVPYVCLAAARSEAPKLMSGARPVYWIYIDDVAAGLIRMAQAGPVNGDYVDLGSGQLVTTGEIAGRICKLSGNGIRPELGAVPDRAMEQVRVADVAGAHAQLDWSVAVDLDAGLRHTYEWYRQLATDAG